MVIRLGVTGLKKTWLLCFLDLFAGMRQGVAGLGWVTACGVLWDDAANGGNGDPIPGNWYRI